MCVSGKRMGQTAFDEFHEAIIETVEHRRVKKAVKAGDHNGGGDTALNRSEIDCSDNASMVTAKQSLADESPRNHGKLT